MISNDLFTCPIQVGSENMNNSEFFIPLSPLDGGFFILNSLFPVNKTYGRLWMFSEHIVTPLSLNQESDIILLPHLHSYAGQTGALVRDL